MVPQATPCCCSGPACASGKVLTAEAGDFSSPDRDLLGSAVMDQSWTSLFSGLNVGRDFARVGFVLSGHGYVGVWGDPGYVSDPVSPWVGSLAWLSLVNCIGDIPYCDGQSMTVYWYEIQIDEQG